MSDDNAAAGSTATRRAHPLFVVVTGILWLAAIALIVFGLLSMIGALDSAGSDPAGRGLSQAIGLLLLLVGGVTSITLWLARRWRGWLIVAALIVGAPAAFFGWWTISLARSEARHRVEMADLRSGKYAFGDQPALFAVAQAIANNDQEAIRAAAKQVPDLQAPGRDGKTLLNFAVRESWQRPELVAAVKTLLEIGANPNFTNGQDESFAMADAIHGSALLLRTMLDGGGNPNTLDARGNPIAFGIWHLNYFEAEQRARLELLVDRGADVNATLRDDETWQGGFSLLLFRTNVGRGDPAAYTDAIYLLDHGADPHRRSPDGTTLAQMLAEHRQYFATTEQSVPPEFEQLWAWLLAHQVLHAGS
jgi:ankyrin repeat protein